MRAEIAVFAMMATTTMATVFVQKCPPYDELDRTVYQPHPYDCSLFLRCVAGQPVLGQCPPGQHFSPNSLMCDSPVHAHCIAKIKTCSLLSPESACPYQCTCHRDNQQSVCPFKLEFSAELHVVDVTLSPYCDRETNYFVLRGNRLGYFLIRNTTAAVTLCEASSRSVTVAHFGDCTKGISCENGQEFILTCPDGYMFDSDTGYCEEPQYVNCRTSSVLPALTDCPQGAAFSTCQHSCTCNVQQGICPARLTFKTSISIFDARRQRACWKGPATIYLDEEFFGTLGIHPNTTTVNHCPVGDQAVPVLFPDPSNCERMLMCKGGSERIIYCPKHLHFDRNKKVCRKPDLAVCQAAPQFTTTVPATNLGVLGTVTCPPAKACPADSRSKVAHLTDCTLFCQCTQGTTTLGACPPGLHFNEQSQTCNTPQYTRCQTFCSSLTVTPRSTWYPEHCASGNSREGTVCKLKCRGKYTPICNPVITCTSKGWHGTGGVNIIPSCNSSEEIAVEMVNVVGTTLNQTADSALLFLLDESGSVRKSNFEIEKNFVDAMVNAFPLSRRRPAGVITFNDPAATVNVNLGETSTCNFLSKLKKIVYSGGGTNIANVLNIARREINIYAPNKKTLVFLITDGKSQTDPTATAQDLRSKNHILFTIGVAWYSRKQLEPISSTHSDGTKLFFGLPNFKVFKVVAEYLKTHYNQGVTYNCP